MTANDDFIEKIKQMVRSNALSDTESFVDEETGEMYMRDKKTDICYKVKMVDLTNKT